MAPLQAQTQFTRVYGPTDRDVAIPSATGVFGHVDSAASAEIIAHIKAVGAPTWHDMSATGKITYPDGDRAEIDDATLSILNSDSYRLDVKTPQGTRSTRLLGGFGAIQESDGTKDFLLPSTAAQGLAAFPQLRVATFPTNQTSIYDKGTLTVDGKALHRLAVERPLGSVAVGDYSPTRKHTPPDILTDLYFDPTSHLLSKSVASIRLSGSRSEFVQCVTYDDYQQIDNSLIPLRLTQSLNGQVQWVLQLDHVELNTGLKQADFHF
jgi:hypothetical protein